MALRRAVFRRASPGSTGHSQLQMVTDKVIWRLPDPPYRLSR